jgi:glyoxylase-like metal-dependent hydrolase (beta-lactamase superfamily II)
MSGHPAYEELRQVSPLAAALLQRNPGPMTLDGTNTWVLRAADADDAVVVDPGEQDDEHLAALLTAAPQIALILLTHGHPDHSGLAPALHEATGAPVRAADPALCLDGPALSDGAALAASGVEIRVAATPGHTSDSVAFIVGPDAAVLTGDTILGRGTTVVAHPDGNLAAYLDSLRRLRDLGDVPALTGHGPELPNVARAADYYLEHRAERLQQVRHALATLGADATPRQIVELVYADVDRAVWWAAELSVAAQLDYLRD